jgi:hypothetical protein
VCGAAHCQHPGGIKTSYVADIAPAHGLRYHNCTHDRATVTIVTRKKNAAENRGVVTQTKRCARRLLTLAEFISDQFQ